MNLEINEDEREMLVRGVALIPDLPGHVMPPTPQRRLIRRLIDLFETTNPVGGTAPAKSPAVGQGDQATPAASGESRTEFECDRHGAAGPFDHWADVKGDIKAEAQTAEIYIEKIDKMPPSSSGASWIKVTYPKVNGGRGFAWAAVWDESLQPLIIKRVHQKTVVKLHVNGKYTNIVGVRA